jgi:hypothetical protein
MPRPEKRWDAETVVSAIKKLHKKGVELNLKNVSHIDMSIVNAAAVYCGSWKNAIEMAGFNYAAIKKKPVSKGKKRFWPNRDLVIQAIQNRVSERKSIKSSVVTMEDSSLYNAARKFFGKNGWAEARVVAGFKPQDIRPNLKWTKQTVREEILRLHHEGVALNSSYVHKSTEYTHLHWAAQNVYGSWRAAIEASGLDYEKIRIKTELLWTRDLILENIRNLEQSGWRLSSKSTQKQYRRLFAAAIRMFGSWQLAVEAAGLDYQQHCQEQTVRRWLSALDLKGYESIMNVNRTRLIHTPKTGRRIRKKGTD